MLELQKYDPSYYEGMRSIPSSNHQAIAEAYKNGTKLKDLAAQFNVNRRTIYRLVKRLGEADSKYENRRKIKQSQYKDILDAYYTNGESIRSIAQRLNVKPKTIRRIVWNNKV